MTFLSRNCSTTSPATSAPSTSGAPSVTSAPAPTINTFSKVTASPASPASFSTRTRSLAATLYCLPPVLMTANIVFWPGWHPVPLAFAPDGAAGICPFSADFVLAGSDPAGGLWQRVFKQNKRRTGRAHARSGCLSVQTARESRPGRRIGLLVPVAFDDPRLRAFGHQFRQV